MQIRPLDTRSESFTQAKSLKTTTDLARSRTMGFEGEHAMIIERSFNLADYYLFDRLSEGLGDSIALRFGPSCLLYTSDAADE